MRRTTRQGRGSPALTSLVVALLSSCVVPACAGSVRGDARLGSPIAVMHEAVDLRAVRLDDLARGFAVEPSDRSWAATLHSVLLDPVSGKVCFVDLRGGSTDAEIRLVSFQHLQSARDGSMLIDEASATRLYRKSGGATDDHIN